MLRNVTPAIARPRARSARAEPARAIAFDACKYGPLLLVDAADPGALPGFITSPAPHVLTFTEIALVGAARGHVHLDGEAVDVRPYRLIVTAAGERRSWSLAGERLAGRLVFFEPAWMDGVSTGTTAAFPFLAGGPGGRAVDVERTQFRRLMRLADAMRDELQALRPDAAHALRALLYGMLVSVQRLFGTPARVVHAEAPHVGAFLRMVDERFLATTRVGDYADALGISPRHLNDCVRRSTGRTASDAIHARRVDAARRRLLRQGASVARVAEDLGFADVSYFVRFFRRHVGVTPARFRRHRISPISVRARH